MQVLQANFEVDSNPDGQDLERIAQITGLSKRVTQVWFQNSRARQKKYKEKKIDLNCALDLNETSQDDIWNHSDMNMSRKRLMNNGNNNNTNQSYQTSYTESSNEIKISKKQSKELRLKHMGNNCGKEKNFIF